MTTATEHTSSGLLQGQIAALKLIRRVMTRVQRESLPFDIRNWVRANPVQQKKASLSEVRRLVSLAKGGDTPNHLAPEDVRRAAPHICGTAACVAGYLVQDQEVQSAHGFRFRQEITVNALESLELTVATRKRENGRKNADLDSGSGYGPEFFVYSVEHDGRTKSFKRFCSEELAGIIGLDGGTANCLFAPSFYVDAGLCEDYAEVTPAMVKYLINRMLEKIDHLGLPRDTWDFWHRASLSDHWGKRFASSAARRQRGGLK